MNARWLCLPFVALMSVSGGLAREPLAEEPEAAQVQAPEELARQSGCFECHRVEKKVIGPPFQAVAAKYKGDTRAREALIAKVSKGGKGNWTEVTGGVPMPPHSPRLSDPEIARLVDWLLGLSTSDPQKKQ